MGKIEENGTSGHPMVASARANERLRDVEGFRVESSDGELGWVEEIWVDDDDEPCAVAIQTTNGRHALVLGEEVVAVHRDRHWIVVPQHAALRELAPPRLLTAGEDGAGERIRASWTTTGSVLTAPARRPPRSRRRAARPTPEKEAAEFGGERPLWEVVGLLYLAIAAFVGLLIGFAFLVAWLVAGIAY